MCACVHLATSVLSYLEFFAPARTDLGVKLLTVTGHGHNYGIILHLIHGLLIIK